MIRFNTNELLVLYIVHLQGGLWSESISARRAVHNAALKVFIGESTCRVMFLNLPPQPYQVFSMHLFQLSAPTDKPLPPMDFVFEWHQRSLHLAQDFVENVWWRLDQCKMNTDGCFVFGLTQWQIVLGHRPQFGNLNQFGKNVANVP